MKHRSIARLQYISQPPHLQNIRKACLAGCRWIQLRVKERPHEEVRRLAVEAAQICHEFDATLIINDHVDIAIQVKCHGVHLGKQDMPVKNARQILGNDLLIGGTANTWEDIKSVTAGGADYIGMGPFRFTQTKKNLSPVLGHKGFNNLLNRYQLENLQIPVIAIGGITPNDVEALMHCGVYGVAVSSAITISSNPAATVNQIFNILYNEQTTNCR